MPRPARHRAVPPKVMTIPEAAEALGIGVNLAYRMARAGELPVVRMGGRVLVSRARLATLLHLDESALMEHDEAESDGASDRAALSVTAEATLNNISETLADWLAKKDGQAPVVHLDVHIVVSHAGRAKMTDDCHTTKEKDR